MANSGLAVLCFPHPRPFSYNVRDAKRCTECCKIVYRFFPGGSSSKWTISPRKISQFIAPTVLENYKTHRPGPAPGCSWGCFTGCCPQAASTAGGMESTFQSVQVKQAWDSVPLVQEAQSPLLPSFLEDREPRTLPLYPVLGVFPAYGGGDYQEQPLVVWIGDFAGIYPRTDTCRIQSTSEPSIPDSVSAVQEKQVDKPATPGTWEDPAEESFTVACSPGPVSERPTVATKHTTQRLVGIAPERAHDGPLETGEVDSGLARTADAHSLPAKLPAPWLLPAGLWQQEALGSSRCLSGVLGRSLCQRGSV